MKYLSFKEFLEKYGLKNEATSNVKIKEILKRLRASGELNIPCGIYMRDDKFTTDSGIVNLHPSVENIGLCIREAPPVQTKTILIHMAAHLHLT